MRFFDRLIHRRSSDFLASGRTPARTPVEAVRLYHAATKHHHQRAARGPHSLDWASQPDPFRRYAGAELLQLPLFDPDSSRTFDEVTEEFHKAGVEVNVRTLSTFLRHALGLSAIKQVGESRWSLRMNPSSGNLHPTEAHLLCGPLPDWRERGFVAHYAPSEHVLEVRAHIDPAGWSEASASWPEGVFFVALSSILWREEWKYGERAFRYCQHDVGHAIAAIAYSASCLGWKVRVVDHLASDQVARIFGLHSFGDAEPEEADTLLAILPSDDRSTPHFSRAALEALTPEIFQGLANELSADHLEWDAIHACAAVTSKPATAPQPELPRAPKLAGPSRPAPAHTIIAKRRSAVAMDGQTSISREAFFTLMQRCLPCASSVPFAAFPWPTRVHLLLFVLRVQDLAPGLYVLLCDPSSGERLLTTLSHNFDPTPIAEAPEGLSLLRLKSATMQSIAASISCDQAIAGQGAFSLGMLAEFDAPLLELGPWAYPRLYWETGLIGQTLYLEAEVEGLRGTGIGCFYDDAMHQLLGLQDSSFQSLYHFTVGGAVEDTRIQTHKPYGARSNS